MGQTASCVSTGCVSGCVVGDGGCHICPPSDQHSDTVKVDVALLNAVVISASRTPRQHPLRAQQRYVQGGDVVDEDIVSGDDAFEEKADGLSFYEKEGTWAEDTIEQSRCHDPVTPGARASRTNCGDVFNASLGSLHVGNPKPIDTTDLHQFYRQKSPDSPACDPPDDVKDEEVDEPVEVQQRLLEAFLAEHAFGSVNARPGTSSPLHVAVEQGDAEMVRLLLQAGADLAHCDSRGNTPDQLAHRRLDNDGSHMRVLSALATTIPTPSSKSSAAAVFVPTPFGRRAMQFLKSSPQRMRPCAWNSRDKQAS